MMSDFLPCAVVGYWMIMRGTQHEKFDRQDSFVVQRPMKIIQSNLLVFGPWWVPSIGLLICIVIPHMVLQTLLIHMMCRCSNHDVVETHWYLQSTDRLCVPHENSWKFTQKCFGNEGLCQLVDWVHEQAVYWLTKAFMAKMCRVNMCITESMYPWY